MNPSGVGCINNRFGSNFDPFSAVDVFFAIGDSIMAQGYMPNTYWTPLLQSVQSSVGIAFHRFCHQGNEPAAYAIQNNVVPLNSFQVPPQPSLRGTWMLQLGWKLNLLGVKPLILEYSQGGSTFDFYNPNVGGNSFAAVWAWMNANYAKVRNARSKTLLVCLGANGTGSNGDWAANASQVYAAFLAQVPGLKMLICQNALSWADNPGKLAIVASQQAYAAAHPTTSAIGYANASTFCDNTYPNPVQGLPTGVHPDEPSVNALAIGPNDANTRSLVTAYQQLRAA